MSASTSKQQHYRFSIDVDGIALPDETVATIDDALQKAAVMAIASIDLRGQELTFSPVMRGMMWPGGDDDGGDGDEPPVGGAQIGIRPVDGGSEIEPLLTPGTAVFRTKLAGSKARGVAAIRVSLAGDDIILDQLGPRGQAMGGFVLHLSVGRSKGRTTLKAVSFTRKGSKPSGSSLGKQERVDLGSIVDELSQFQQGDQPSGPETSASIWGAIGAGIACGLAAVEGGANPLADADCAIAAGEVVSEMEDDDDDDD
jgi:hypothetical protein